MFEDELLKLRFKAGRTDALQRIYEKYRDSLLTLAMALVNDTATAEDVVHDVFLSFAQQATGFGLRGSLKAYLATCVANRARDRVRSERARQRLAEGCTTTPLAADEPDQSLVYSERCEQLSRALAELPYEQREVVLLRLKANLKFRDIARLRYVSGTRWGTRRHMDMDRLKEMQEAEVAMADNAAA